MGNKRGHHHFAPTHAPACRIGFLDIDEFIVPVDPAASIGQVLARYQGEAAAGVHFNRLVRVSRTSPH